MTSKPRAKHGATICLNQMHLRNGYGPVTDHERGIDDSTGRAKLMLD